MLILQNNTKTTKYEALINNTANFLFKYLQKDNYVLIRLVDKVEIKKLNNNYRQQNKATNVLSFPSYVPDEIDNSLGDVIICLEVVKNEAKEQNKTTQNHLTHIVVHGFLHLLGYDHMSNDEAKVMENLEIEILQKLGINNPY
jgi:probable rRNA maturation factor